ncbi:MAG: SDR family NAD(P)-dependent oxidoreductase [Myxococcales bacterium]|nr:SDR family NAD(P)-dependent oxidoreductase [Myxococcales bacterium]
MSRTVLVTGGLGMLGSAAVRQLVRRGDAVRVLDCRLPRHGANDQNLADEAGRFELIEADLRDAEALKRALAGVDAVVHAAGHVSHVAGVEAPQRDVAHNVEASVALLDGVRRVCPEARLVFCSTRGVYGAPEALPVSERAPLAPRGMHEWSKVAAEEAFRTFGRLHGLTSVSLRITNAYGPGGQLKSPEFGVITWWVGQALQGLPIKVFGDGLVRRDLVFVDDIAEAVIAAVDSPEALPEVINVGSPEGLSLREIAAAICDAVGPEARYELVPYTAARKAMEVGDFVSDITLAQRHLAWAPRTALDAGMRRTVSHYRQHLRAYV